MVKKVVARFLMSSTQMAEAPSILMSLQVFWKVQDFTFQKKIFKRSVSPLMPMAMERLIFRSS